MPAVVTTQTDLLDEIVTANGRRIVDVGCGDGWLVRGLAARGATVIGVDPAAGALAAAQAAEVVGAERYVSAGAADLPFADASFDVVVFFNSLHHVPADQLDRALAEALRVCMPDGIVFVQEPLASGAFFQLMQPVDDETVPRAAALQALRRAMLLDEVGEASERDFTPEVRVAGFEAWREHQVLVEPGRAAALAAGEAQLRERFEELGEWDGERWRFDAPARVTVLRRGG